MGYLRMFKAMLLRYKLTAKELFSPIHRGAQITVLRSIFICVLVKIALSPLPLNVVIGRRSDGDGGTGMYGYTWTPDIVMKQKDGVA